MATTIQIKRTANIAAPTTANLAEGELGYSQDKSNSGAGAKLYIASVNSGGTPVIDTVGGKYYTATVDAATNLNTASTIVKRDASGNFSAGTITATLSGTASTATNVANSGITGNIIASQLQPTGVTPLTYGGAAAVPVLTIDAQGRVTAAANAAITVASETFRTISVSGQSDIVADSATDTLTIANTAPVSITTNATTDTLTVGLLASGVSATTYGGATSIPVLVVDTYGRVTSASNASISTSYTLSDGSNTQSIAGGDTLTVTGGTGVHAIVSATDTLTLSLKNSGVTASTYGAAAVQPVFTVDAFGRITSASNVTSTVANSNITGNIIASQIQPTGVTAGTYGGAATVPVYTVDAQGRLTTAANATISIPSSAINTDIALGSQTSGAYVANLVQGTGISLSGLGLEGTTPTIALATSGVSAATYGSATIVPVFTVDTYGRITSVSNTSITAGVTSITGTSNQITASASTGAVTLSLPTTVNLTDLNLSGNLTVNGLVTTVNSTTITVDDKNIELGSVTSPTNVTADGGGITLKGDTDKTFNWVNSTTSWTSSENLDLASGKTFKINTATVLDSTGLGTNIVNSNLTSLGTVTTGTWSASTIATNKGGTGLTSFTANAVPYASTTSVLSFATGTAGQVLQLSTAGVPTFAGLDGGTY